jgi:2-oxoglutarate ferredoxin oxidoreductase subunit gamma
MYTDVMMTGFGGQGILLIGNLLAEAALLENFNVTYLPSYGVEMRGGAANCTVVISDSEIGSPQVSAPEALMVMSEQARAKYEAKLKPGGIYIVNSSLVNVDGIRRRDVERLVIPFNEAAVEMGSAKYANMLALGAYLARKPVVKLASIEEMLKSAFAGKKPELVSLNLKAIVRGIELADGLKNSGGK